MSTGCISSSTTTLETFRSSRKQIRVQIRVQLFSYSEICNSEMLDQGKVTSDTSKISDQINQNQLL